SKKEIIKTGEEMGTYSISIEPHEDCCSLFVPKHPETRSAVKKVQELEGFLDVDKLVADAVNRTEDMSS
ncbi:MAG: tRNA 4-thiouridine(8) synthase ThiI, partial [Nanoarchaeota archaeon]|nr:tRNA 4-thiouridine(8) synthase ThiI [Nanoarchaeota archaeon]